MPRRKRLLYENHDESGWCVYFKLEEWPEVLTALRLSGLREGHDYHLDIGPRYTYPRRRGTDASIILLWDEPEEVEVGPRIR